MTFQIGEKVVYPNQGVGVIENISSRSFGTQCERFYLLRLTYSCMTVMVPFSNVGNIGLRKICKNTEINRILHFLAHGECDSIADWKLRFKENTDKMQSGSLLQAAEVLKTLLILQQDKPRTTLWNCERLISTHELKTTGKLEAKYGFNILSAVVTEISASESCQAT